MHARLAEIKTILRKYLWYWFSFFWIFIAGVAFGYIVASGTPIKAVLQGFIDGIWAELIGIAFTIFIIDQIYRSSEEQRNIRERNERLIRQIGSTVNDVAKDAVHEAQKLGLLAGETGLLQGADLTEANLAGANLVFANLTNTNLTVANLEGARLIGANLDGAKLNHVNLKKANLANANLTDTRLNFSNLQGTFLNSADLQDSYLMEANLIEVDFTNTNYDKLILPDRKHGTKDTDMTHFTNPEHPDFWQPEWVRAGFNSYLDWARASEPNPDANTENP